MRRIFEARGGIVKRVRESHSACHENSDFPEWCSESNPRCVIMFTICSELIHVIYVMRCAVLSR